jgi:hypothetical protein
MAHGIRRKPAARNTPCNALDISPQQAICANSQKASFLADCSLALSTSGLFALSISLPKFLFCVRRASRVAVMGNGSTRVRARPGRVGCGRGSSNSTTSSSSRELCKRSIESVQSDEIVGDRGGIEINARQPHHAGLSGYFDDRRDVAMAGGVSLGQSVARRRRA